MSVTYCPLYNDAYYSYDIDLNDETFTLTFRWNSRMEQYVMDVQDAEEEYVIQGAALVPAFPILRQYSLEELDGDFIVAPYEEASLFSPVPEPRNLADSHFMVFDTDF